MARVAPLATLACSGLWLCPAVLQRWLDGHRLIIPQLQPDEEIGLGPYSISALLQAGGLIGTPLSTQLVWGWQAK